MPTDHLESLATFRPKPMYEVSDLTRLFSIGTEAINTLIDTGELPAFILQNNQKPTRRVPHSNLVKWLRRTQGMEYALRRLERAIELSELEMEVIDC